MLQKGGLNCSSFSLRYNAFGYYTCGHIYIYIANGLELSVLLTDLGWAGIYKGLIILAVFIFLGVRQ